MRSSRRPARRGQRDRLLHWRHAAASTLAYMAATNDRRVVSATLFTTLLDFSDVGDIRSSSTTSSSSWPTSIWTASGYLEGHHMAEAFNLLRENDLIWFFFVNNYLLGRDPAAFDLLYWNSDSTRMPAAMQTLLSAQHVSQERV